MLLLAKIVLLLLVTVYGALSNPVLTISQGTLQGEYLASFFKGRTISSFTGIPYAQPPVGDLRFQAPQPALPWSGILDASKPLPTCTQISAGFKMGGEDCLYLNVYTPQINPEDQKLLPVMLFIHGGGFSIGSGNKNYFNPSLILDYDVVLVVPNYRVGPLGFFSTGDDVVPGNNALKDQNLAIKWTKENIQQFGGNPNNLTIAGNSAGAACSHFHMISPLSKDLINGVISQSGTTLALWAVAPNDEGVRLSRKLAEAVNCTSQVSVELVECLRKVDAVDFTKAQEVLPEWRNEPDVALKPVIEPNIEGAFLTEHPIDIIKAGKAAKIPFITGINTDEGALKRTELYGNPQKLKEFNEDFDRVAPISLLYGPTSPDKDNVTKRIREFYFGDGPIDDSTGPEVTQVFTDVYFFASVDEAVRLHVTYIQEPVYYYAFGYRGSVSLTEISGDTTDYGVSHGDEGLYLFVQNGTFPDYASNAADRSMMEILPELWTNFATTGNPTPSTTSKIPTIWKPVQTENLEYYFIKSATDMKMEENLYRERAELWRTLPLRAGIGKANTNPFLYIIVISTVCLRSFI